MAQLLPPSVSACTPDIIAFAKGVTTGTVPMGARVRARRKIYDALMRDPSTRSSCSMGTPIPAHPVACAAGLATLDLYRDEELFARAAAIESHFADAAMTLRGVPGILDIRTVGLAAGIDLASKPEGYGRRASAVMEQAFDNGLVIRATGDTLAIAPPLIASEREIDEIFATLGKVITAVG